MKAVITVIGKDSVGILAKFQRPVQRLMLISWK